MNTTVRLTFTEVASGSSAKVLPRVDFLSDPSAGAKHTVIEGNRADGSILIPGGKKSAVINVKGYLYNASGYAALMTDRATLNTNITNELATLTLEYFSAGWNTTWTYTVRRQGDIRFTGDSLRTDYLQYEIDFLILVY